LIHTYELFFISVSHSIAVFTKERLIILCYGGIANVVVCI